MFRPLEPTFRLNTKSWLLRTETCRCKVLKTKINTVVLDYVLSIDLTTGSKHKGGALPKNYTWAEALREIAENVRYRYTGSTIIILRCAIPVVCLKYKVR